VVSFLGQRCFFIGSNPQGCIPEPLYFLGWFVAVSFVVGGIAVWTTGAGSPRSSSDFDQEKWKALLAYDSDVAAVAEKLNILGAKWVHEFARAYLALNDKKYLGDIATKIIRQAKEEDARRSEEEVREANRRDEKFRNRGRVI